jgi:hypothetical protein
VFVFLRKEKVYRDESRRRRWQLRVVGGGKRLTYGNVIYFDAEM